jgi:hypothetical protein
MSSRIIIQVLLIAAVGIIGWMMLRSPSGARHQAGRRIVTLAFVIFAFVSIAVPSVVSRIAYFVGVGRGTDLLLYALVVAFLAQMLSTFRRHAALERQITRLARRIALDTVPDPTGPQAPRGSETATPFPASEPPTERPEEE